MSKVSVIIPVYNTEKYLEKCLDSVINQTYTDIEIICINDGSTDNSLSVLKKYAKNDKRIKLIDLQQNKGVSTARNIGIDTATGDYILFLDPDDWWESEIIKYTVSKIKESDSDIVVFGSNYCNKNKITVNNEHLEYLSETSKQENKKTLKSNIVYYVWDKLYKTDFIKNNNIRFIQQISQTEDVIFGLECISYKPKIVYVPKCFYNYRVNRKGSAMNNTSNLVTNQINALKTMLDCNFYTASNNDFKQFCINILLGGVVYFYILTSKNKFSLKDFIELRKLAPYMRTKISPELLNNNFQYNVLSNLTSANLKNGVSCLKQR